MFLLMFIFGFIVGIIFTIAGFMALPIEDKNESEV